MKNVMMRIKKIIKTLVKEEVEKQLNEQIETIKKQQIYEIMEVWDDIINKKVAETNIQHFQEISKYLEEEIKENDENA